MRRATLLGIVIGLAVLALGAGGFVTARTVALHCCAEPTCRPQALGEALGLSAEQQAEVAALNEALRERQEPLLEEVRRKRQEMLAALREPTPDRVRVERSIEEISQLQTELQRATADHLLALAEVLEEPQRERLVRLLAEAMCPGAMLDGEGACMSLEGARDAR